MEKRNNIQLENWFSYHAPKPEQIECYNAIRNAAKVLAYVIFDNTPFGADRAAALQKLRECVMLANASIACDET